MRTPSETAYRNLFKADIEPVLLDDIRESVNSGLALGTDHVKREIEELYQRRLTLGKPGSPVAVKDIG